MQDQRRCLIIDQQPTIRIGVRGLLAEDYEVEEAADGREALGLMTAVGDFDVAIVELAATNGHDTLTGLPAIRALRKASPALGIVAHAARPERHGASESMSAGAQAYVAKCSPATALVRAVDAAAESESFIDPAAGVTEAGQDITRRQRQILQLYANGLSTEHTAQRLGVSTETVRTHTKAVLSRLAARDRAHAVAIGLRSSLIE